MRIAIIGYSGAGKSTLAQRLGEALELPVLHLDTVHWLPGWQVRDKEGRDRMVLDFLSQNENGWIIDGNYSGMLHEERMAAAHLIIFLDFPRRVCLARAWTRYRQNKGKTRSSMTDGCDERFDFEFVKWILVDGRNKKRKAAFENVAKNHPEKFIRCKNNSQVEAAFRNIIQNFSSQTG